MRCRATNAAYQADCRRTPRLAIDAAPARQHLAALTSQGLGTRHIAQLAGVSRRTIVRITQGLATIRPAVSTAILAVRPQLARGAVIPGTVAWRHIDSLEREGYTRQTLARLMGSRSHQLQLHRRLTVTSALRIAALYYRLTRDGLASEPRDFAARESSDPREILQPQAS